MNKHKSEVFLFIALVMSLIFVSMSFLLIPIETDVMVGDLSLMPFLSGIIFWVFLVLAAVLLITLSLKRRKFYVIYKLKQSEKHKTIGLLSFFKNKYAVVTDILMFMSVGLLLMVLVVTGGKYYDSYVAITIFLSLLFMHSIFNGKLFFYICALRKTIKNNAKKLVNGKGSCK